MFRLGFGQKDLGDPTVTLTAKLHELCPTDLLVFRVVSGEQATGHRLAAAV
jgi:hypothetical protein